MKIESQSHAVRSRHVIPYAGGMEFQRTIVLINALAGRLLMLQGPLRHGTKLSVTQRLGSISACCSNQNDSKVVLGVTPSTNGVCHLAPPWLSGGVLAQSMALHHAPALIIPMRLVINSVTAVI